MMRYLSLRKDLIAAFFVCAVGYAGVSSAHDAGATLDPEGNSESFTGMAFITCFEGSDRIEVSIRDSSPPVPGLLVNVQVYKGDKANSITDTISGDADWSKTIALQGGVGTYWLLVNKTDIGARAFEVRYHCLAADGEHTETAIGVSQFGLPEFVLE